LIGDHSAYLAPLFGCLAIDYNILCIDIGLGIGYFAFFFSFLWQHTIFSWHTSFPQHTVDPVTAH